MIYLPLPLGRPLVGPRAPGRTCLRAPVHPLLLCRHSCRMKQRGVWRGPPGRSSVWNESVSQACVRLSILVLPCKADLRQPASWRTRDACLSSSGAELSQSTLRFGLDQALFAWPTCAEGPCEPACTPPGAGVALMLEARMEETSRRAFLLVRGLPLDNMPTFWRRCAQPAAPQ